MAEKASITKQSVKKIASERDYVALVALFDIDPDRVRRFLVRLTYQPDGPEHDAAIDCIRHLSAARSAERPDFFAETIRRFIWAMNEEGGNNAWSAPEIIGAVIAGNPEEYGQYFSFAFFAAVDEKMFQPSLVRAYMLVRDADPEQFAVFGPRTAELAQSIGMELSH